MDNDMDDGRSQEPLKSPEYISLSVLTRIDSERAYQDMKYGGESHTAPEWLSILIEETGEVAREVKECIWRERRVNLENELVQVAAVAIAWLEDIERKRNVRT